MIKRLQTRNWSYLKSFLPHSSGIRIAFVSLSAFLGGLAESAVLVIIALTADSLIRGSGHITVLGFRVPMTQAVVGALILVIGRVVTTLGGYFVGARFSALVMLQAQRELAAAYLSTSHAARSSRDVGDLATVAVNHGRFVGDLAGGYTVLASAICGLVAFGGMSLVVNPIATLTITVVGVILIAGMRPLRTRNKAASIAYSEISRTLGAAATQLELLNREIEVFSVRGPVLADLNKELQVGAKQLERLRFISNSLPQVFQTALLGAAVLSLLVIVNTAEGANLASIGAVVLLLIRSMSATQQVVTITQQIVERGAYGKAVTEMISSLREQQPEYGTALPTTLTPVVLKDVGFSYNGVDLALTGISTRFSAGEVVGIVGPSGAGKSTLVEILLRLRESTAGSITCGSVPIDEVARMEFGRRVAFVPQKAVLINGTVAENVDFFRNLPPEKIEAALRGAHLADEIEVLPDGIDTILGPDSRSLSGGQQQRLTIARALAGEPEILILDEPTSALDALSEEAIRQTLDDLPADRLVVIVAHRYSTLSSCDRILVIEDGLLVADAPTAEVTASSPFFRKMAGDDTSVDSW